MFLTSSQSRLVLAIEGYGGILATFLFEVVFTVINSFPLVRYQASIVALSYNVQFFILSFNALFELKAQKQNIAICLVLSSLLYYLG